MPTGKIKERTTRIEILTYLEEMRWPEGVVCPYRTASKCYVTNIPNIYICADNQRRFNVLTGTPLQNNLRSITTIYKIVEYTIRAKDEEYIATTLGISYTTIMRIYKIIYSALKIIPPRRKDEYRQKLVLYIRKYNLKMEDIFKGLLGI